LTNRAWRSNSAERERERADSGFRFGLERCRRGDSSERERKFVGPTEI